MTDVGAAANDLPLRVAKHAAGVCGIRKDTERQDGECLAGRELDLGNVAAGYSALPPAPQTLGWSLQHCSYIPPSQLLEPRMGRLLGRIVVGATLFLISFIAYSSQIFIIWPWYGRELSVDLITLLGPFKYVLLNIILPTLD